MPELSETRRRLSVVLAGGFFLLGSILAAFTLLLTAALVREYGPGQGNLNIVVQSLPIIVVGLGLAGVLGWVGKRLLKPQRPR